MRKLSIIAILLLITASPLFAYPLNGFKKTGIKRLEGYYYSLNTASGKKNFEKGALLKEEDIKLRLLDKKIILPKQDLDFSRKLKELLGSAASVYGVSLLDLSDPERPLYAAHNDNRIFNPASVGKIIVALALFQTLADIYQDDVVARKKVLRESEIIADHFIISDSHEVPFWLRDEERIKFRPIQIGDKANLWSYLDWMLSASSNAAASIVIKETLALKHFGKRYPPTLEEKNHFFARTNKRELSSLLISILTNTVKRNNLNIGELSQGGFFTRTARSAIPGSSSRASTKELLKYLVLLEEGKLVDKFSSLEIKKLLYMTQKRIRYASSPALSPAAVYYKSGSLYSCKQEVGFVCEDYSGNVDNTMNSVAIVEYPAKNPKFYYLVSLTSNTLRKNSALAHQILATKIQHLIEERHKSKDLPK